MNGAMNGAPRWTVHRGASPIVGTAIHDGHHVPPDVEARMALSEADRRREEDPYTGYTIRDVPNRVVVHWSRFVVDLNRARGEAVYVSPDQSWGLDVWRNPPPIETVTRALQLHDAYYLMLGTLLGQLRQRHGRFVLLDIHSYNYRREVPEAPPADPALMPQINIGTFSMDRDRWANVVDPFMERLRAFEFRGHNMDVRENVSFQGKGEQARFVHTEFPDTGCAIAIEFKKFFMDEWTGRPDREALVALRAMIRSTLPLLEQILGTQA